MMNPANENWGALLRDPSAYPHLRLGEVEVHETHISWVCLAGDFAYKIKKPVHNAFLDYRNLADRQRYCREELRLDSRFAPELYVDVVPITVENGRFRVEGRGEPVEYAVKMRRFPSGALLSEQLRAGQVSLGDIVQLAETIAQAHSDAQVAHPRITDALQQTLREAVENLCQLQPQVCHEAAESLRQLQVWTRDTFEEHEREFAERITSGHIRECHGDLHTGNIVRWQGRLLPFDGIEFNDDFRWIDVLCDVAFLAMDLIAQRRADLSHLLINAYLEQTADRSSLTLLRWYIVYRALVRAKVAGLRAEQLVVDQADPSPALSQRDELIALARQLTLRAEPTLFIMHGVSGSGKTSISTQLVARHGAIRLRSDVERKRMFEHEPTFRPNANQSQAIYAVDATEKTYARLISEAEVILAAGYAVVLDATFLLRYQRHTAQELARRLGIDYAIVNCAADTETLRQRLAARAQQATDASDATLHVLDCQLISREPLTEDESPYVINLPLEL
jgi:aminoglycoside phosphotransferase family enzyme/predicted kinase